MTTQQRLLSYDDPRLQLRANVASLTDPLTRSAMRVLDDLLSHQKEGLLSAPAIGLPVRLISIKTGDRLGHFLNPRIASAGDMRINRGELNPLTGRIKRNVWRAFQVTLEGTDLSGQPRSVNLAGAMAIAAQQAFELFDRPQAFDWLTAFHQSWARARDPVAVARFQSIQTGLFAAPDAATEAAATTPLACTGLRQVELRDDEARPLCVIDMLNPQHPLRALDRSILASLLALSGLRNILMMTPTAAPVVIASLAMVTKLTVYHAASGWPVHALGLLGLAPALQAAPIDEHGIPQGGDIRQDAILLEDGHPILAGAEAITALRRLGKQLSGSGGVLMISALARDPLLEDQLAAAFPALHLVNSPEGVIYLASKTRLDIDKSRARLITIANACGATDLPEAFADVIDLVRMPSEGQSI